MSEKFTKLLIVESLHHAIAQPPPPAAVSLVSPTSSWSVKSLIFSNEECETSNNIKGPWIILVSSLNVALGSALIILTFMSYRCMSWITLWASFKPPGYASWRRLGCPWSLTFSLDHHIRSTNSPTHHFSDSQSAKPAFLIPAQPRMHNGFPGKARPHRAYRSCQLWKTFRIICVDVIFDPVRQMLFRKLSTKAKTTVVRNQSFPSE